MLMLSLLAQTADDIIGTVDAPTGVAQYGSVADGGLLLFISNIIRLITIIAGIWVLITFILAGFTYATSQGESSTLNKVKDQITSAVLGLVIIVAAYTIIALISLLLFKDPGFILNPKIPSPV